MTPPPKQRSFVIPSLDSPGCALAPIALFLLMLGGVLLLATTASFLHHPRDVGLTLFLLVFAVLFSALGLGTLREVFSNADAVQLFETDLAEATQLTPREHKILAAVQTEIANAPDPQRVGQILSQRTAELVMANPALQPIAFGIKRQRLATYIKGALLEVWTWLLLLFSIPVISLLGLAGAAFAWTTGKAALRNALVRSRNSRRYRTRSWRILLKDDRFPILYLRGFSEEYGQRLEGFFPATAEERLTADFGRFGPVIAVGEPHENVPFLGASRLYFDNQTWQAAVLYLMSTARIVIIHAGFASGVLWELGVARARVEPERLLISFGAWADLTPDARHINYLRYKKFAEEILRCKLPEYAANIALISFDSDWNASPQLRRRHF